MDPDADLGEVILEFTRIGAYLKCNALHAGTGLEVSVMGPVHERHSLQRIVLAKLRRALAANPSGL